MNPAGLASAVLLSPVHCTELQKSPRRYHLCAPPPSPCIPPPSPPPCVLQPPAPVITNEYIVTKQQQELCEDGLGLLNRLVLAPFKFPFETAGQLAGTMLTVEALLKHKIYSADLAIGSSVAATMTADQLTAWGVIGADVNRLVAGSSSTGAEQPVRKRKKDHAAGGENQAPNTGKRSGEGLIRRLASQFKDEIDRGLANPLGVRARECAMRVRIIMHPR